MLTRRLWYALNHPNLQSPVFRRLWAQYRLLVLPRRSLNALLTPLLFALTLTPFGSTYYGLALTLHVAWAFDREKLRHTFDLLGAAPPGSFQAAWALACVCYLQQKRSHEFHNLMYWGLVIPLGFMTCFLVVLGSWLAPAASLRVVAAALTIVPLLLALYADHFQSLVLGVLCGALASVYEDGRLNARLYGSAAFLGLQAGSYLGLGLALLAAYNLLPVALPLVGSLGLLAAREALTGGIWQQLLAHTGANERESGEVFRGKAYADVETVARAEPS